MIPIDPTKLNEIEERLEAIQEAAREIVDEFSINLVDSLQKSVLNTDRLVEKFKLGEDISKSLTASIKKAETTQDNLTISLIKKKVALSEIEGKSPSDPKKNAKNEKKKENLTNEINAILKQQELNVEVLEELGLLGQSVALQDIKNNKISRLTEIYDRHLRASVQQITNLFTITGLIAAIIKGAIEFNKSSVEISKNLGYAGDRADALQYSFYKTSITSKNLNVNSAALGKAMNEIAESTGYISEFSEDALETQIMLTKQFGLTGKEAARIYELSVLTGKSSSQVNESMVGAFASTRNQLKVGVPFKETMAAAARVSGQLAANLQNNPANIVKAVVQAAALGTTLEQTANQAERLLDFTSSIESELKAELLTGKQLNLEKARAAALSGDQVTLAQELAKNVGTLQEFEKMNVIQQKALAEAMGLTADQLAEQLKKQQIAQTTGKSIAQQNADELLNAQKRQSLQETFNALISRLSDIIGVIASGPLGILLGKFADLLSNAWALNTLIVAIGAIGVLKMGIGLKNAGGFLNSLISGSKSLLENLTNIGKSKASQVAEDATDTVTGKIEEKISDSVGDKSEGLIDKLSKIKGAELIKAAAAMVIAAGAIWVFGKAVQELEKVNDWGNVAIGLLLFVTTLGISALILNAASAIIWPAVAMLGAFGAAVFLFGIGLGEATPGIEAFGGMLSKVFTGIAEVISSTFTGISLMFDTLGKIDSNKLLLIGPSLVGIGLGLVTLGAGAALGNIGLLVAVLTINKLSSYSDGLIKTSTSLELISQGISKITSSLALLDLSKLEALDNYASNRAKEALIAGISNVLLSPFTSSINNDSRDGNETTSNTRLENNDVITPTIIQPTLTSVKTLPNPSPTTNDKPLDLSTMIAAINQVKDAVNKLHAKDSNVYLDGRKVGSTLVQGSYKLA